MVFARSKPSWRVPGISRAFCLNLGVVMRTGLAVLTVAGIACAAAPAAEQAYTIAPGVRVFGATVGGLTAQPARSEIQRAFSRPLEIVYRGETLLVEPRQLRARANVDAAVRAALTATPRSRISLPIRFSRPDVARYVDELAQQFDRRSRNARVVGATAAGPLIRDGRVGLAVDRPAMRRALEKQLATGSRSPLVLMMRPVIPARTVGNLGAIVVIDRARNSLRLYDGRRLVRTFGVATGASYYPTPSGLFDIVSMQRDPWWLPPNSDWARGLKPVPPGPGNPLGTRWMGISAPGVGIHGTPNAASIGYSQSHGCIRMHIPEAEWLFTNVAVGTPVVIL
jgi:lipoprotein-anchoring transpeptidase ErfK/SrfK